MVIWIFRAKDGVRRGIGYNYKNGSWTVLRMPVLAFGEQKVFERPLVGLAGGWGFLDRPDGVPVSFGLQTNSIDGGEVNRYKLWDMVRVDAEGSASVEVRFGFGDSPGEPDEWTPWVALERDNWLGRESVFLTAEFRF